MGSMRVLVLAASAAAVLVFLPGLEPTWPAEWAGRAEGATSADRGASGSTVGTRLHDGAKAFGEGLLGGIKFVGRTVISPFTGTTDRVGRDADVTGKRLHRGAKGFGEGLLGGAKFAGRTIVGFFNDDKGGR